MRKLFDLRSFRRRARRSNAFRGARQNLFQFATNRSSKKKNKTGKNIDFDNCFQQRYEILNQAAHLHADFDRRETSLMENFLFLQTKFEQIRQIDSDSSILVELQVRKTVRTFFFRFFDVSLCFFKKFRLERQESEEEFQRVIELCQQILPQTSMNAGDRMKINLKLFQNKFRAFSADVQSFEVKTRIV